MAAARVNSSAATYSRFTTFSPEEDNNKNKKKIEKKIIRPSHTNHIICRY